nr:JAB domain-containing protein [Sphingopyxis sp. JAI108]
MASSEKAEARRQRSALADFIALVAPADGERLASALLAEFHSLARARSQTREALERVVGPGSPVAALLHLSHELQIEGYAENLRHIAIDPFAPALRKYLIASMGALPDEHLRVLFLDGAQRLIADEQLQHGSLAQLSIYPRTIFRRALELNAAGLILVHNHPSGDATPSEEDIHATRMLDQIGRGLDVRLVDHIVVTETHAHHIVNGDRGGRRQNPSSLTLRTPAREPLADLHETALANARIAARRRLLRQQLFGAPELFGDPSWEMLIDLFIHQAEGKDLSITALCIPVGLPLSSALRLVQKLCDAGILRRLRDPIDGRRSIIRLEPASWHRLCAYFGAGDV